MGDTQIIPSSNNDKNKIVSDEILFEDENAHLYLTFNPTIKKIHCVIYLTEIDNAFVGEDFKPCRITHNRREHSELSKKILR